MFDFYSDIGVLSQVSDNTVNPCSMPYRHSLIWTPLLRTGFEVVVIFIVSSDILKRK